MTYYPDADGWERRAPAEAGIDPEGLRAAVEYAKTTDTPAEHVAFDFSNQEPWNPAEGRYGYLVGPMPDRRGGANGIVLEDGYVVAEWGDTTRVDHAFSVAKSVLSIVTGVAYDRGLVEPGDSVAESVDDGGFDGEHNGAIAWEHLLQQTSEWEGTLFGRPDRVDRNRAVGRDGSDLDKREDRELREPGTFWEYNDVRINRLALAVLRVLGEPLPAVLRREVMDPIGASDDWEWHGYRNSTVAVDGRLVESVSGGGHWGGGLWISTRDLARVGLLMLGRGRWDGRRVLSEEWVDLSTAPCEAMPTYGYLWWLNTDGGLWPSAPGSSFAAVGHGWNTLWVDPEHDLVVVLRWLAPHEDSEERADFPHMDGFYRRLLDALEG